MQRISGVGAAQDSTVSGDIHLSASSVDMASAVVGVPHCITHLHTSTANAHTAISQRPLVESAQPVHRQFVISFGGGSGVSDEELQHNCLFLVPRKSLSVAGEWCRQRRG